MFPWIWEKLSWKESVLVRSEILGLLVKSLTAEYQYSRRNMQNFQKQPQAQLSQKQKVIFGFALGFLKCTSSLEHFERKDERSSLSILEIINSKGSGYINV